MISSQVSEFQQFFFFLFFGCAGSSLLRGLSFSCVKRGLLSSCRFLTVGASQVTLVVKNLPAKAGDIRDSGLVPGSGRSPGGGSGNPLQDSCLGNPRTEEPGGLQSTGLQRVGHNGAAEPSTLDVSGVEPS